MDLGSLLPSNPPGWVACILIIALFLWGVVQVGQGKRAARLRVAMVRDLITNVEPADLVARQGEIAWRAQQSSDQHVQNAWREFDETLVRTPDGSRLWNTQNASAFFGPESLASELIRNPLLRAAPGLLTAIGVLFTFYGLTQGLGSLAISSDSTVPELMTGVNPLIEGAGTAFISSLWGVFFSAVLTFVHRLVETGIGKRIDGLQSDIDKLFEYRSAEQALVDIQHHTKESSQSLDDMAEKIGNKLQEVVSQNFSDAAAKAAVQNSAVFEQLVEQFTAEFRGMGVTLADRLDAATAGLAETLGAMTTATREQVRLLDERLPQVVTNLDLAAKRIGTASESLDASSGKLRATADIFDNAAGRLGDAVADGTEKLDEVQTQASESISTIVQISTRLESLNTTTLTAARQIGEAAGQVNGGFAELQDRIKALTASVKEWLNDYEQEVGRQVEHRMSEWNTHTRDFSDQMTRATKALSGVMEDIEATTSQSGKQFDNLHQKLSDYTETLGAAVARMDAPQSAAMGASEPASSDGSEEVTDATPDPVGTAR